MATFCRGNRGYDCRTRCTTESVEKLYQNAIDNMGNLNGDLRKPVKGQKAQIRLRLCCNADMKTSKGKDGCK